MSYIVYYKGTGNAIFIGHSQESVDNFIRENDFYNRMAHGWDCELDEYEVVCVRGNGGNS